MEIAYLCGGEGARLRPLTYIVPKPMLPIGSRPILELNIQQAKEQGFKCVFLLVNYKSDVIEGYFGNGEEFGVDIHYVYENEPRGTAGSLLNLQSEIDGPLVVMNADVLTDLNLSELLDFHKKNSCKLTIALKRIRMRIPYGLVQLDDEKKFINLEEKPLKEYLINSGIYVVSKDVIDLIPSEGKYHMTDLIESAKDTGHLVAGFEFDNHWRDIGRLNDYLKAAHIEETQGNGTPLEHYGFSFSETEE